MPRKRGRTAIYLRNKSRFDPFSSAAGDERLDVGEAFVGLRLHQPEQHLLAQLAIGVGGDDAALAELAPIYTDGDAEVKRAVLEAYMIAGDEDAVFAIAIGATDPQTYEEAVRMLAAMGATDKLRELREQRGVSDALIEGYLIAGDLESLEALAADGSDPARQREAIEALGAAGGREAAPQLAEIYRGTDSADIREAALEGILISGNDDVMLELFRAADNTAEKRALLEMLVLMDSDAVWEIVDQTLEGGQ